MISIRNDPHGWLGDGGWWVEWHRHNRAPPPNSKHSGEESIIQVVGAGAHSCCLWDKHSEWVYQAPTPDRQRNKQTSAARTPLTRCNLNNLSSECELREIPPPSHFVLAKSHFIGFTRFWQILSIYSSHSLYSNFIGSCFPPLNQY